MASAVESVHVNWKLSLTRDYAVIVDQLGVDASIFRTANAGARYRSELEKTVAVIALPVFR